MPPPWEKSYDQPRQHIKKQRHYFPDNTPYHQTYGFSTSHLWMWELDHKESWARNNWCFWTMLLKKTLESPLDCKEVNPVNAKGNQSWIFIGRTDAEAETPIFWPPDVKSWLIGKGPDTGEDWRQEETGTTEDEMVGWHHHLMVWVWASSWQLVMDREAWRACGPCGHKEWDTTERLTERNWSQRCRSSDSCVEGWFCDLSIHGICYLRWILEPIFCGYCETNGF